MLKMFRFALLVALALMLVAPLASAQKATGEKVLRDVYYSEAATPPAQGPPGAGWTLGFPPTIANGAAVWFASPNEYIQENQKDYWLRLLGANAFNLTADTAIGYDSLGVEVPYVSEIGKSAFGVGGVQFHVLFKPQPEWEVIKVKNNSGAAIALTGASAESKCSRLDTPVPSLTTYGIIILALLLMISTVWVIMKKRAGVPA